MFVILLLIKLYWPTAVDKPIFEILDKQCQKDSDCSIDKSCIRGDCLDPCSLRGACGTSAICEVINHRPRCTCPECYTGSPFIRCKAKRNCKPKQPQPPQRCQTNKDCPNDKYCETNVGMCKSPCGATSVCPPHEHCVASLHKGSCQCKNKLVINAAGELTCPGRGQDNTCTSDDTCPPHLACVNQICQTPCHSAACPPGKNCAVLNHKALCMCASECESSVSICLKDRGCPPDEACINYKCQNPCDKLSCPGNTPCVVEDHQPVCKFCPPGFIADPNYGCLQGTTGEKSRSCQKIKTITTCSSIILTTHISLTIITKQKTEESIINQFNTTWL